MGEPYKETGLLPGSTQNNDSGYHSNEAGNIQAIPEIPLTFPNTIAKNRLNSAARADPGNAAVRRGYAMTRHKIDNFDDLFHLQRRIHSLIQDQASLLQQPGIAFAPVADIFETAEKFLILMEVPGVQRADIEIVFDENDLRIRGLKRGVTDSTEVKIHRMEGEFGEFRRVFRFETPVDREKIEAIIRNGVLAVSVYKKFQRVAVEINGNR